MLTDALEHLVRGIVDNPDDVSVEARRQRGRNPRSGEMLEVRVNPDDLGRVIGRSGRTATALRTVVQALDKGDKVRIDFVDVDRRS
ncbi:MAG: RNA-binding protein [Nocardioidaceae bacterium]